MTGQGGDDRAWMRWVLIIVYAGIGIVHLTSTDAFLAIMPDWVPEPRLVVIVTGLCEIAGALALMTTRLRRLAGIMLALYAVCVFPANVKQALDHIAIPPIPDTWWYHGPRFAMQPVMVWWALYAVRVIDWPFGRREELGEKDHVIPGRPGHGKRASERAGTVRPPPV